MTMTEFAILCGRYNIEPNMALENDNIVDTLRLMKETKDNNTKSGYRNILVQQLETEF